jgi:hypothetical protein
MALKEIQGEVVADLRSATAFVAVADQKGYA